ncbi:phage tail protein [Nocardia brasiliensis]|uniref:phage tail protein n=1 Tax=Nocardia brasiliensis TaxID=37326 RepID=UPI0033C8880A
MIAAIASRVAKEIGQITAAFLVLQGVVRLASFLTNFGKRLAIMTVGASAAIGVVSGLATMVGSTLATALSAGVVALGAFAGAAVGLGGPAIAALKVGMAGLKDGAAEFNKQFADADEALNKMIGQRMGPALKALHGLKTEMKDVFSHELAKEFTAGAGSAFTQVGALADTLRPKMGYLSAVVAQIGYEISASLTGPAATGAFQQMTDASINFFQHLNAGENGLGNLSKGFAMFTATAATTFQDSSASANEFFLNLGDKLAGITPEQIRGAMSQFSQVFENIGNVAAPLFSLFRQMGQISAAALAPGFKAVGQAIQDATPSLVNMANIIMPAIGEVIARLAPLIPRLVEAFTPWATTLATIAPPLATVVSHLAPLAPYLLAAATAFKVAGAVMLLWNAATFAGAVAQGVFAAAMGRSAATVAGSTIALAAHRIALIAGSVAAHAFGVAMAFATSPIGLIIIAVAAVAAALWAFFTKTEVGKRMWEKIWPAIKNAVAVVWEFLKVAWQWILTGLQWIGDKAMWLWHNAIQPAGAGIVAAFQAVATGATWLWQNILQPAFTGIGAVIAYFWDTIGSPIFNNIKTAIGLVGEAISFWWTNVATPAFEAVGNVISWLWTEHAQPVFENVKTGVSAVGDAFTWFNDNAVSPAVEGVSTAVSAVWDSTLSPIFDKAKTGIGLVGDAFSAAGGLIKDAWSGIADALRPAIHAIGGILSKVPEKIGRWEIPGAKIANDLGNAMMKFRTGGMVIGAGTGTSDSIIARVSTGEFIEPAAAVTPQTLPLLEAIRAGWVPSPEFLQMLVGNVPGFAGGGTVRVNEGDISATQRGMWDALRTAYPDAILTSATRYADVGSGFDHHMGGKAIDVAGPDMVGMANWIAKHYPGSLELIHSNGFSNNIKNGENVGNGLSFYGAGTMADHADHLHWAMSSAPSVPTVEPDSGASALTTGGNNGGGGASGGGTSGGGTSGGTSGGGTGTRPAGNAVPVWVDNWPSSLSTSGSGVTGAADTTTTADTSGVTATADNTDSSFDQAAAINAAFAKFNSSIGDAGQTFLKGQKSAIPAVGGYVEGIEKQVSNINIVVADVYEAVNRFTREQKRQTAGK